MTTSKKLITTFTTQDFYLSYGGSVGVVLEIKSRNDEEGLQYFVSIELYDEGKPSRRVSIPMEEIDELIGLLHEVEKILLDLMTTGEVE